MTYAFTSINGLAAEPQIADSGAVAATMQVLILAPDAAFGAMMGASMASDPLVEAHLMVGTLAEAVADNDRDWAACDFVVFHTRVDDDADLEAVRALLARPEVRLHCIAMTDAPVSDAQRATLFEAGVQEVLPAPVRPALSLGDFKVTPAASAAPVDAVQDALPATAPASDEMPTSRRGAAGSEPPRAARFHLSLPASELGLTDDAAPAPEPALPLPTPDRDVSADPLPAKGGNPAPAPKASPPTALAPVLRPGSGRITAVLRARGGSGASTLAVNLAADLARQGSGGPRVALVDLDIQNGSVAILMDLPDSAEVSKLLSIGAMPDDAFLDRAMTRHASGVDVLAAPDVFAPLSAVTPAMMTALVGLLQQRYDQIVFDMPQAMMDWIEPVLDHAATALLVTDTSVPAIKRTRRLIDILGEEHMTLSVQVVVNREKRPLFLSPAQKEAARLLGRDLAHWIPEDAATARKALDSGVPLLMGARRSRTAKAIQSLGKTLFAPARTTPEQEKS
ncbi:AAA family ATPase [Puniceibacterium confluentis]|uniref:AAA family ATPase n=1 Tax=Puniceibacterium confluentis TaxID=1958944 RepID=UPI0035655D59